jgi:hypothetical protein
MFLEEHSSASKIVKIAYQQNLGLLLFNCYCLVFELLLLTSPHIFNYIWSYRTPIQAKFTALER